MGRGVGAKNAQGKSTCRTFPNYAHTSPTLVHIQSPIDKPKRDLDSYSEYPKGVKSLDVKGKPIGIIPYDLGKAKCDYADELKRQDIARGKSVRPDKYYHDKAWKALGIDDELKRRGFK